MLLVSCVLSQSGDGQAALKRNLQKGTGNEQPPWNVQID